jgi:hypothetical protein
LALPKGTYTWSIVTSATSGTIDLQLFNKDNELITMQQLPISNFNTRNSVTFSVDEEIGFVGFYTNTQTDIVNIQLESGEVMTDFEEYQETSAYVLTSEPPRLGDVLYKENGLWKCKHRTAELIFDGVNTLFTGADAWKTNGINLAYVILEHNREWNIGFSNIGISHNITEHLVTEGVLIQTRNASISVCIADEISGVVSTDSTTTIRNKINNWCKDNPVHIIYELATPTIEILDTESQIALNGLETFEGVTHVVFDSRVQPLEFEAEVGLSKDTAYTLKCMNDNDTDRVERAELKAQLNELSVALVAMGSEV